MSEVFSAVTMSIVPLAVDGDQQTNSAPVLQKVASNAVYHVIMYLVV